MATVPESVAKFSLRTLRSDLVSCPLPEAQSGVHWRSSETAERARLRCGVVRRVLVTEYTTAGVVSDRSAAMAVTARPGAPWGASALVRRACRWLQYSGEPSVPCSGEGGRRADGPVRRCSGRPITPRGCCVRCVRAAFFPVRVCALVA